MMWTGVFFSVAMLAATFFYLQRVGIHFGLTSVLLGLMLIFHGPAYLYYTRIWGPETEFFEQILSAAPGANVIGTLDVALGLTFLGVCVGVAMADLLCGVDKRHHKHAIDEWAASPVRMAPAMVARVKVLAVGGIAILLAFALIDNQLVNIYNYAVSDAGEFEKIGMRRDLGGSQIYLYNLLVASVFPFIAFCLLILKREGTRKIRWMLLAFVALLVVAKAATLSKAPLAVLLLQLLTVEYMRRSLKLTFMMIVKLLAFSVGLFVAMAFVANPTLDEALVVLTFLFYRVFMIVNEGLMEYFAAIPYVLPHTWGSQSSWVATLFQSDPQEATFWLVGEVHRGVSGSTTTVMFMGDAWADFAWAGVVLVPVVAGLFLRWLDIQLIIRRGKTVVTVAGLALGHYGIFIALSTALQTAMVTGGLLFVLPLVALISGGQPKRNPEPSQDAEPARTFLN